MSVDFSIFAKMKKTEYFASIKYLHLKRNTPAQIEAIVKRLEAEFKRDLSPKKIPFTRILFCLVRTGANFAILVQMTKFKFSKKNKERKLI